MRRRRGDGPSLRMTSKNPGGTLPSSLLTASGRQCEGQAEVTVRSSLLRGTLVAAVYSLCLITSSALSALTQASPICPSS